MDRHSSNVLIKFPDWFNPNFAGKTVSSVEAQPRENGTFTDLFVFFTDGTRVEIGATKDGCLVCCPEN
jgi:hypothetical protein